MAKFTIDNIKFNSEGTCPICGGQMIEYDSVEVDGCSMWYPCTCEKCGATWNEVYNLQFAGVDDVVDNDGNEFNTYTEVTE